MKLNERAREQIILNQLQCKVICQIHHRIRSCAWEWTNERLCATTFHPTINFSINFKHFLWLFAEHANL